MFTINLSLPPEQRYLELCNALKSEINNLTSLFDDVVGSMVPLVPLPWLHFACKLLLRGVHNKDENAELRGISAATGVSMYLLVCFNVLLDLFMGCSSGGAAVRNDERLEAHDGTLPWKMLHFRTLDWGMPALRQIVVRLDFVTEVDGPVVARCVTYAGFVGVLTGVRKGFSESLNFRPTRKDRGKRMADWRYGWHLGMVLLGFRPSISSVLRGFLLPTKTGRGKWEVMDYRSVLGEVVGFDWTRHRVNDNALVSTACYLCFSDGEETTVIEKDLVTSEIRSDCDFIVVTNNDAEPSSPDSTEFGTKDSPFVGDLAEIIHEAKDRKECAEQNWKRMQRVQAERQSLNLSAATVQEKRTLLHVDDVIELVQKFPTTNETTHYACVMDPILGTVRWCRRWQRPVSAKWIREHQSETW